MESKFSNLKHLKKGKKKGDKLIKINKLCSKFNSYCNSFIERWVSIKLKYTNVKSRMKDSYRVLKKIKIDIVRRLILPLLAVV